MEVCFLMIEDSPLRLSHLGSIRLTEVVYLGYNVSVILLTHSRIMSQSLILL